MNSLNQTFLPTKNSTTRNWFIIDCKGETLGRLATIITTILKGKIKPYYYPSIDVGDHVILINADLVVLNEKSKHYLVYNPGRPGSSLKVRKVSECLIQLTIKKAVKGMLAKTETKRLLRRLNIYTGKSHPHKAQKPIKLNLSDLSSNIKV